MANFQNVLALKGLYEQAGEISEEQFQGFSRKLIEGNPFVQTFEFISDDFVIRRVYPTAANRKLKELDLKRFPDATVDTARASASLVGTGREPVALSAPFVTKRGTRGIGIISPVVSENSIRGYVAAIINLDLLTASLRKKEMRSDVDFSFKIGSTWLQEPSPHKFYREKKFVIYDKEIILGAGTGGGGLISYKRLLIGYAWVTLIVGLIGYFRHMNRESSRLISEISVISHERANLELLMERIFDSSKLGVAVYDGSGRIIMHNRHVKEILHIHDSVIDENIFDLDIPETLADQCREILKSKRERVESFEVATEEDTRVIWYSCLLCRPQVEKENYYYLITQDITIHKKLLQDRYEQQKMETVGQLAAGIAHDFNNILSASSGYIEILKEKMISGEFADATSYVANIGKMNERAAGLVSKLLGYARRGKTEAVTFDLKEILSTLIEMSRNTFPKGIEMKSSLPLEQLLILGDVNQIESAFLNILINARDSMETRGTLRLSGEIKNLGEMKSTIGITPPSSRFIEIAISDTGTGMDKETLEKIFEPFFSTKREKGGSGLGLAMCYGIIKSHGGYIFADSVPRQGSTFTIYLPLVDTSIKKEQEPIDFPAPDGGKGRHVLVIDDEEDIVKFLREALHSKGYMVTSLSKPLEGIELLQKEPAEFDIILLDYSMPKMTGVECAERLKDINETLKIVLMSGYCEDQLIHRVTKAGVIDGYLKKPFKLNDLFKTISSLT